MVRIYALVITFVRKCSKKPLSIETNTDEANNKFSVFHSVETYQSKNSGPFLTDININLALTYLYRKAANEVVKFNPASKVEKVGTMRNGILFSKGRILDSMNFAETGGLNLPDLNLIGIKSNVPVVDRFSPLAYTIANHIHWDVAKHKGIESCNRISLCHVNILQSANLFKEIGEECLRCRMKRKKTIEVPMGPVSDHQLRVCPPFWATQADIFGPIQVYVPGYERNTRGRNALAAKCWVLTFVCPVTRLTNLQVIEKSDHVGIVDGITRLSCEIGIPKFIMIDQDAALLKAVQGVEFDYMDTKFKLHTDWGIEFSVCPVAGHNQHGQVERRIRSVQESLNEAGLKNKKFTATGLQTLLKLVENQINNLPLGFSFGKDQDNTPLLKMLSPNMLRVGRINERALDGPMRLPSCSAELLQQVERMYSSWFRIWNDSYVPKLMFQPKWWRQECDLKEEDVVLFQKKDGELDNAWSLGRIDQLVKSRDGLSRRAVIRYQNAKENFMRTSDRHIRSLIKVWAVDDQNVDEDLAQLEIRLRSTERGSQLVRDLLAMSCSQRSLMMDNSLVKPSVDGCCCRSHCGVSCISGADATVGSLHGLFTVNGYSLPPLLAQDMFVGENSDEDSLDGEEEQVGDCSCQCSVTSLMMNSHLNLH